MQQDAAQFTEAVISSLYDEANNEASQSHLYELFGTELVQEFDCAASLINNCQKTLGHPISYTAYLPVPAVNSTSLQESFNQLLRTEVMEKQCPHPTCHSEIANSKTSISKLPKIIVAAVQRFTSLNNMPAIKLRHSIEIPSTFEPYLGAPRYILTGAVVHIGNAANYGHYVSLGTLSK